MFGCNNDPLFPKKLLLLKSYKFNMATMSVKRSIPLIMLGVILCIFFNIVRVFLWMKLFDGYQNVLTTGDVGVYQEIVLPATICWKKET